MRRLCLALTLVVVMLAACRQPEVSPPSEGEGKAPRVTDEGPGMPVDHPAAAAARTLATARRARRMSVDQLRASFPVVLGTGSGGEPIRWRTPRGDGLRAYGRLLGEPDYLSVVEESVEPSVLYTKLMSDAALDLCDQVLAADAARADASSRTLYRHVGLEDTADSHPAEVARNLRYLKLRFHGVHLPTSDPNALLPLQRLFSETVRTAAGASVQPSSVHVREGWRAVCVALLTAPEFHIY